MRNRLKSRLLLWTLFMTVLLGNENSGESLRPTVDFRQQASATTIHVTFPTTQNLWQKLLADPEGYATFGYGFAFGPGDPAYPAYTVLVPIPLDVHSKPTVSILNQTTKKLQPIPIPRTPVLRQEVQTKAPIEISPELNDPIVEKNWFSIGDPVRMGDQNILPITIFPLEPGGTGSLTLLTEIELSLPAGAPISENPDHALLRIVPTPDGVFQQLGAYLIITPPAFQPYLANFIAWKERMGHPVTVVTTSQFSPLTAESIRAYIQNAYLTWDTPPRYVLLIGDNDQGMPTFVVQSPEGLNRVTDHPYTMLTGDDDFPELLVGRLSVDSFYETSVVTSKIIRYESNPWMDSSDWFKKGLMLCTTIGAASTAQVKNWVRRKMLEKGFSHVDTVYAPEENRLIKITTPINAGVGFINYRGYGYYGGWAGPDFNSGNIDQLNNGWRLPIVTSIVCGGGNFAAPDDPCFGEKWIRAGTTSAPKGAVAFFGPSELYTHVMFNNAIDIGIYHAIFDEGITELGEALWQGKLELWRNYHQTGSPPFGQTPEYYFHIYNLLGDPGMNVWTDTPAEITVSHPANLQFGDRSISVHVTNAEGQPVQGAFVFVKNVTNALGYETDVYGNVTLPVVVDGSSIDLTVTGKNLRPYLETITIDQTPHALAITDIQWNGNEPIVAGQSITPTLTLEGGSANLSDVEITLECNSPWAFVTQGQTIIPELDAGELAQIQTGLVLTTDALTPDSTLVFAQLFINTGTENWSLELPLLIHGPRLVFLPVEITFGNASPGDSVTCHFSIANFGSASASAGVGEIRVSDGIQCSETTLNWNDISPGEQFTTNQSISLVFSETMFPGDTPEIDLITATDTLRQVLHLRSPGPFDPSVTDNYGYRVFGSEDLAYTKAPTFNWYEIDRLNTGPGFPLNIHDEGDEEDATLVVQLPFPVKYYGRVYTQATVCSNGWVAMGVSPEVSFRNRTIPSPAGPYAMIAPFWDDLYTSPGRVSHYTAPDLSHYILEWKDMANAYSGQLESFQVIFYNDTTVTPTGDTEIKFQYLHYYNADGYENFATIGIESPDATDGVLVSYANVNDPSILGLEDGRALLFTTDRGTRLPAAAIMVDQTELNFTLNPWDWAEDSIMITNVGESPLMYHIQQVETAARSGQLGGEIVLPSSRTHTKTEAEPQVSARDAMRDSSDAFGYTWRDETDPACPLYDWVNIEQPENLLENPNDPDDAVWGPEPIGFEFSFYDNGYNAYWINSNGFISFSPITSQSFYNQPLPSVEAQPDMIAAWWDDLNGGSFTPGQIFVWNNGIDSSIVTFKNMPRWGTSLTYTFQIIMEIGGTMTLQYGELQGPTTSATIGIQNATSDIGLTVLYNSISNIDDHTILQILRPNGWFMASQWSGTLAPGESGSFPVRIVTRGLTPGDYSIPLQLLSNANNAPDIALNVNLQVALGTLPPGDVNQDYRVNVLDFNLMVEMILQRVAASPTQISAGDLHPDGIIDVLDLVALLDVILQ
ncbi:MAG: hypothetical protein CO167_12265 [Candidatus Marinimicrobia bacterium CG_4_9_14_3_um_filter_48_9]|nr:MAG: hypothetical protein CO167_12265 [Candidatus Marinimicrobia bacterium CG_4_9_14_3_um_filter_48_9]